MLRDACDCTIETAPAGGAVPGLHISEAWGIADAVSRRVAARRGARA